MIFELITVRRKCDSNMKYNISWFVVRKHLVFHKIMIFREFCKDLWDINEHFMSEMKLLQVLKITENFHW